MPVPKRWFPVSHDLNRDPETWDLTDCCGERALRLWLEILSILDRHQNRLDASEQSLAALSRLVRQSVASVRRTIVWMVHNEWLDVGERTADNSPVFYTSSNYFKYHRRREIKGSFIGSPQGNQSGSHIAPL